jgi:hypothetical protein
LHIAPHVFTHIASAPSASWHGMFIVQATSSIEQPFATQF